jgi:hypothetical protein
MNKLVLFKEYTNMYKYVYIMNFLSIHSIFATEVVIIFW